jgi:hypothetical protein
LSKVSVSEVTKHRRKRTPNNDDEAITTKILTPFQAQRVLLISRLRELVINGYSPLATQAELGISQRQYYRLRQKAFEHDCKLIEQWDSDTLREHLAIWLARQQKILAFFMDKMEDPNAHDITRLKAAQLATELSDAIYRTGYEGVIKVKNHAESDWDNRIHSIPLQTYLIEKGINPENLAQLKKAQRQLDKEEEGKNKNNRS